MHHFDKITDKLLLCDTFSRHCTTQILIFAAFAFIKEFLIQWNSRELNNSRFNLKSADILFELFPPTNFLSFIRGPKDKSVSYFAVLLAHLRWCNTKTMIKNIWETKNGNCERRLHKWNLVSNYSTNLTGVRNFIFDCCKILLIELIMYWLTVPHWAGTAGFPVPGTL